MSRILDLRTKFRTRKKRFRNREILDFAGYGSIDSQIAEWNKTERYREIGGNGRRTRLRQTRTHIDRRTLRQSSDLVLCAMPLFSSRIMTLFNYLARDGSSELWSLSVQRRIMIYDIIYRYIFCKSLRRKCDRHGQKFDPLPFFGTRKYFSDFLCFWWIIFKEIAKPQNMKFFIFVLQNSIFARICWRSS